MKILIINKFLHPNGGSETYIFNIGKQLEKMGHAVQYFGMEHKGRIVGNRIESYTSDMDFHTSKLKKFVYPFKIIYSIEARRKLAPVLKDFKPDVIHLNNFNFQITPSVIYEIRKYEKERGKKVKIVYTAHDYQLVCPNHMLLNPGTGQNCDKCVSGSPFSCAKDKCIHGSFTKSLIGSTEGWIYRKNHVYREIDTIICPSHFMKEKLSCFPDLNRKLIVMHNFVERKKCEKRRKQDYVLYFGRYSEEKGVKTLLNVCRQLPEIPFIFAGSGPLGAEVNSVKNVCNKGFLSGEELYQVIANASFTVFPSEWFENCPFSVMETQIYGTPVLASDLGGTRELVENGVSGELFQAGNEKQLSEKIKKMWNNRELVDKYTEGCRAIEFDTVQEYCDKLMKIYAEHEN